MAFIVRPLTDDGLVGYDQFGQLAVTRVDRGHETSWFIADVREMVCSICNHGWQPNSVSMADQYRWDLVDGYVHESCLDRHGGLVERAEFRGALIAARVRFSGLKPIENGYHGPSSKRPWYVAELLDHPVMFKLGSRKRVDHVEVIAQGGTALAWHEEAGKAFEKEDVTKHFTPTSILLHAWNAEKMRAYVRLLAEIGKLAATTGSTGR